MYYIGVDLGGTKIAAGLVDENGKIMRKDSTPTLNQRAAEEIVHDMAELCKRVVSAAGVSMEEVVSIGVGSPGAPDPINGVIIYANNLNFRNTPIRKFLQKEINLPVYVENDANCAALGEGTSGAAQGYRNSVTITLGTGVGGGIVVDGKIYSGTFFAGGELGHHVICVNGEKCSCGRHGCFEAYASATALIRDTRVAFAKNPDSKIRDLVNGDIRLINAKTAFDAADLGDEVARLVVENYIRYVAEGVANIINFLQPEIVVIGGGVSMQGASLLDPIKDLVDSLVYGVEGNKTKLKLAELGNDAGIVGAAMLGKK